jgi:SAM-dependent methyltransferase
LTRTPTAASLLDRTDPELVAAAMGWKVASWTRALREALAHLPADLTGKAVLEVGGGAYGLNLLMARLGCRVVCTDRRLDFTREAIALHGRHGLACAHVMTDAKRLALRPASFDVVVMKSVLGGIYSQAGREGALECLAEVRRVMRPGGTLIALEQLLGDPLTRVLRRVRFPDRRWHYFTAQEFTLGAATSLMDGFDEVTWRAVTLSSHNAEDWLSHRNPLVRVAVALDQVVEPLVPRDWKHLIAVVARVGAAGPSRP